MQSLEVIARNNAEATAAEIPEQRAAGNWVVAVYSGLNYVGHTSHPSAAEAQAKIDALAADNTPGERTQLLEPLAQAEETGDASSNTDENPQGGSENQDPAGGDGDTTLPASQVGLVNASVSDGSVITDASGSGQDASASADTAAQGNDTADTAAAL